MLEVVGDLFQGLYLLGWQTDGQERLLVELLGYFHSDPPDDEALVSTSEHRFNGPEAHSAFDIKPGHTIGVDWVDAAGGTRSLKQRCQRYFLLNATYVDGIGAHNFLQKIFQ